MGVFIEQATKIKAIDDLTPISTKQQSHNVVNLQKTNIIIYGKPTINIINIIKTTPQTT